MKRVKLITFGVLYSTVFTILCLLIISVIMTRFNLDEQFIPITIIIVFCLSVLAGTIATTKKLKKNGGLLGLIISLFYLFILYTISSIYIRDFSLTKQSFEMIISTTALGTIGGIIGVNIK